MTCHPSHEVRLSGQTRTRAGNPLWACVALAFSLVLCAAAPKHVAAEEPAVDQAGGLKDSSPQRRPMMISIFTGLNLDYATWGFPLNLGGRFYLPIMHNGFIPSLNDEFGLEFGLDFNFTFISDRYAYYDHSTVVGFAVPIEAMYDFHITRSFDAYVKAGFAFGNDFSDYLHDGFYVSFISAVGMRLAITDGLYFRAEVGYPWIKAGLGFAI